MSTPQDQHWTLQHDTDGIAWLTLDRADASTNTLNHAVLEGLEAQLHQLTQEKTQGLIIRSGKSNGFIAGADITQFTDIKDSETAFARVRHAQRIFDTLEQLPFPTVAIIHGFCLGGGLELALACDYRIADNSATTKIGLPEVKLGLQPGWGGTVRLPQLIGAPKALSMILSGTIIPAKTAQKWGIVDEAVPQRCLAHAARHYIRTQPQQHRPKGWARWSNLWPVRPLIGYTALRALRQKANPAHYPAPFAALKNWTSHGVSRPQSMQHEATSIAQLMMTPTSKQLVRLFFLQERLKGYAKQGAYTPQHIHVIGAGTMGADIAAWCVFKGLRVTLQDQTPQQLSGALHKAHTLLHKKQRNPAQVQAAMDRLIPDTEGHGVRSADIVIEAVFEDSTVKQALFRTLEPQLKPTALLATNTSCIALEDLYPALKRPERLVGLHFFNPVAKMPLVEIIAGTKTDPACVQHAMAFIGTIGRLPLPVKSAPGFLVNRVLLPYLLEAVVLIEAGVSIEDIDQAARDFGMPMGPITLADTIGLDICYASAKNLLKGNEARIPKLLIQKVHAEKLGVKTQIGFYTYQNGKKIAPLTPHPLKTILDKATLTERLIAPMLKEAQACVAEGIIADGDLADAGIIFGTGFAPFRGGPITYSKTPS